MLEDEYFLGTKLYRKQLMDVYKPLLYYLGVNYFIFINIDKNGRMFNVNNSPKWTERLLQEKYYKLDPFLVHPDNICNGFCLDESSDDQEFKDKFLYDQVVNFDFCHSFVYIEKHPNNSGYFGLGFTASKDNYQINAKLVNESVLIKKFIRLLTRDFITVIEKDLKDNSVDFSALKGDLFYTQKGLNFNANQSYENKLALLCELGVLDKDINKDLLMNVNLSPQEIKCLRVYNESRSIKKVSKQIGIAVTTATSYIENIKQKLNCYNKNDLFEKTEILELLGRI